ncbi:MAG: hypothetical protein AAB375_02050 [Patescibacteria group bacterium]
MNKKTLTIAGVVVAVLVVAGAANRFLGKSAAERAIEAATGGNADVNSDDGDVTVKTDDGTWSTSAKLPADFPNDVPLYPGAIVQGSVASAQQQGGGHYAGLEITDSIDKVMSWYKSEVPAKGWKVNASYEVDGGLMLGGTKDTRELVVTISKDGDKVAIGLVVTQK